MEAPLSNIDMLSVLKQQNQTIMVYQKLCEEKDKRISLLEEKIKNLEIELEKYKKNQNQNIISDTKGDKTTSTPFDCAYDFSKFNIQERIPIIKIEPKNGCIYTMKKLNDERIACGFSNGNIIIFSKEKYEKEIELKSFHNGHITFLTQLKNNMLISCGSDGVINFFKILENQYNLIQTIKAHSGRAMKLRELDNNQLVSCSEDCTLNFYIYQKEYIIEQTIKTNISIYNEMETKNGKLVLTGSTDKIQFFDISKRKLENQINGIKLYGSLSNNMININEKLLAVGGTDNIFIINVITQTKINEVKIPGSSCITCFCKLNDNILLTGDCSNSIRQFKITGEFLIQEKLKEKSHGSQIRMIENFNNGIIITCSDDESFKLW